MLIYELASLEYNVLVKMRTPRKVAVKLLWLLIGIVFNLTTLANPPLPIPNFLSNRWKEFATRPVKNLPAPQLGATKTQVLTLKDAILLAIRNNPEVRNAKLDRVVQKFQLVVAHNEFEPQYSLAGDATFKPGTSPSITVAPKVKVKTPLGTTFSTTLNNEFGEGHETSAQLSVTQPLLKGLGPDVNLVNLHDQENTEQINRLSLKETLMNTITTVISHYYDLVEAYRRLKVQKAQLKQAEQQLENTQLSIKLGKKAPAQAVQEQASVASQKLSVATQENSIKQAYQTLLIDLGLNPRASLMIDKSIDHRALKIPKLDDSIKIALAHNVEFQKELLNLEIAKRAVLTARDEQKPQLDLTASETHEISNSGQFTHNSTFAEVGNAGGRSVALELDVPLDDKNLQENLISAKIGLAQQKIQIAAARRDLITKIINDIRDLNSQKRQIKLAEDTVKYGRINYKNDQMRYYYGKIDSFQLTTDQKQLIEDEENLISEQVTFITTFANFETDLGVTLDRWDIQLQY